MDLPLGALEAPAAGAPLVQIAIARRRDHRLHGGAALAGHRPPERARRAPGPCRRPRLARAGPRAVGRPPLRRRVRRAGGRRVRRLLGHRAAHRRRARRGPARQPVALPHPPGALQLLRRGAPRRRAARPRRAPGAARAAPAGRVPGAGRRRAAARLRRLRADGLPPRRRLAPDVRPGRDALGSHPPGDDQRRDPLRPGHDRPRPGGQAGRRPSAGRPARRAGRALRA